MKRQRETGSEGAGAASGVKKQRKGFSVGPANLPDGLHKRKGMSKAGDGFGCAKYRF